MELRKLEIGSEHRPAEGYEHLDIIKYPHVEIVADARKIPIDDNTYDEVYSQWVLEHFMEHEVVNVLKEWRRVLRAGGKVRAITNNQKSINECLEKGQITWKEWTRLTFGIKKETTAENIVVEECHKVGFSPDSIGQYFTDAGFTEVKVEATWGCERDEGEPGCPGIIVEAIK